MSYFLISIFGAPIRGPITRYLVPKFETINEEYAKNWTLNGLKPSGAPNMYQESTPIIFSLQTCIRGPGLGPWIPNLQKNRIFAFLAEIPVI